MVDASNKLSAPSRRTNWGFALALVAVALAPWLVWRSMLSIELLGWDSYPLIAASRADSLWQALGEFGDELMDGRYPFGHYWRPLTHLTFTLDHALWGIDPRGYHVTDLALLSINSVLIALLARRWLGAAIGWAAGFWFTAHLVHVDILPAPARRADSLAVLFTLLALLAVSSTRLSRGARRIASALACACALMSKEPGIVAAALVVAYPSFAGAPRSITARVRDAVREGWATVAVVATVFAARYAVLGTVGGTEKARVVDAVLEAPQMWLRYAPAAWMPSGLRTGAVAGGVALVVFVALLGAAWFAARTRVESERDSARSGIARGGLVLFLMLWFLVLASITAMAGAERRWYDLPFAALNALMVPTLVSTLLDRALARVDARWRGAILAGGLLALSWPGVVLAIRPELYVPKELAELSRTQRSYLDRLSAAILGARPGATLAPRGYVQESLCELPGLDGSQRSITVLAPYSVQAFLDLVAPDKPVRLRYPGAPNGPASAADILVMLRP